MSDEIEEGELNSDVEDSELNDTISSALKKSKDEFELVSTSGNTGLKDTNPYEEEDEMILQLKIKALQSLLETQPSTASVSRKKRSSGSSSSSKLQKKHHNNEMKTKRIVTTMKSNNLGNKFQRNIASKFPRKKKLKPKQFNGSAAPNSSYRIFQSKDNLVNTKDNYDVQDMEIESIPSTSSHQFMPQISPLMCLTNYNNEPTDDHNALNYITQQQNFRANTALQLSNPDFYFNQNLQLQQLYGHVPQNQLDKFYQVIGHLPTNNHNPMSPNLIPSLLGPHPLQMSRSFPDTYPDPNMLTLEQQQNELNSLIEARYQQQQNLRRNFDYATSNEINHTLVNARPNQLKTSGKAENARNISTVELSDDSPVEANSPTEQRVIFRVSSQSPSGSSATSMSPSANAPKKTGACNERAFADLEAESPTKSKNNNIEAVTKQVDDILTTLNDRIQSVDVDSFEKEKILKANLLRKLMAIKSDVSMANNDQLPDSVEGKADQEPDEDKNKADAEEDLNQLRTKLLANLSMKRREKQQQQLELQQQERQEKQMDKDMYLLKRKLQEYELMIVEKETTRAAVASKATNQVKSSTQASMYRKIKPVIIRLNQSVSEDEEYAEVVPNPETLEARKQQPPPVPTLSLQDNITQFLKEAKNQAERIALHSLIPSCQIYNQQANDPKPTPFQKDPVPVAEPKQVPEKSSATPAESSIQKSLSESEKMLFVKSLRDRINLETKQIGSLQKTSLELKQIEAKKLKDIESTRLKIVTLREQLVAAEKVLKVNQESAQTARLQHQLVDSKLEKFQNSKRVRQQFLQKVLAISSLKKPILQPTQAKPVQLPISSSTPALPTQSRAELVANSKPPAQKRKSPEIPMEQLPTKSKQMEVAKEETIGMESIQPPLPFVPTVVEQQPPLPLEPPPLPSQQSPPLQSQTQPPLPKSPPKTSLKPPLPPSPPPLQTAPTETPSPPFPPQPPMSEQPPTKATLPPSSSKLALFSLKNHPNLTLGGVVAATAKSCIKPSVSSSKYSLSNVPKKPSNTTSYSSTTRPNLFISKQTDQKLEQLAKNSSILHSANSSKRLINNVQSKSHANNSVAKSTCEVSTEKRQNLQHRQRLTECLDKLIKKTPAHCESLDMWTYESITPVTIKEAKPLVFKSKTQTSVNSSTLVNLTSANAGSFYNHLTNATGGTFDKCIEATDIYPVEDAGVYESPLKVFRGYRFSDNFAKANPLEEAYSKYYCNAIDFRKPFCPFDMHGTCKDSNCTYQHLNVMTMDNLQRTEHLLSYCPSLLELSSQHPSQKEAVKKLKLYAKQFMSTNLNKMSIKDYFKHLYEQVMDNVKLDFPTSTILSRAPVLCINHNKSFGVHEMELSSKHIESSLLPLPTSPTSALTKTQASIPADQLDVLLDSILSINMNRSLDIKLKSSAKPKIDVDWIRAENDTSSGAGYLSPSEVLLAWIYHAREVYAENKMSDVSGKCNSVQVVLNIFSNALESNAKLELVWLVYLRTYLHQKNALKDYHEICLLCLDNLITYDLIWYMLNTCPGEYLHLLIELYEKFLLSVTCEDQLREFEQSGDNVEGTTCGTGRVSFYLMELILYDVNLKLIDSRDHTESKELLSKYLHRSEIVSKLEPNDLCLIWLSAIHLEAFSSLPNMLKCSSLLNSRVHKYFDSQTFWRLDSNNRRVFNRNFHQRLSKIYTNIENTQKCVTNIDQRQTDSFLLPWNFNYECSIEKIQSLFYEALKAINNRVCTTGTSTANKQLARLISLPLFINLITLEISNKRHEVAAKLCERLLKSSDAEILRELWISQIFIYRSQSFESPNSSIESTIKSALKIFPMDAQITFVSAQYFASVGQANKAIELIEILVESYFFDDDSDIDKNFEISTLFRKLLRLDKQIQTGSFKLDSNSEDSIEPLEKFTEKIQSQLLCISASYCFYMQLKGETHFTHELICQTYESLIKSFSLQNSRSIMWTRYFRYISSYNSSTTERILSLIKTCILDMNDVSFRNLSDATSDLMIPFHYNSKISSLAYQSCYDNNYFKNGPATTAVDSTAATSRGPYYPGNNDSNDEILSAGMLSNCNYYYYNCLVDLWLRLYTRTAHEKCQLIRFLMELMPYNADAIRLYINYGAKALGVKATLQFVYDHLNLHSITSEPLWILCIKLCLDLNDLQQAMLMYQRAETVCSRQKTSVVSLKKLGSLLFPSQESLATNL